jgi:hypothetical protein
LLNFQLAQGWSFAYKNDSYNLPIPLFIICTPIGIATNIIDLESNPTKLIEIVEIGKTVLDDARSLTTLSITNDVSKYFAITPAAFASTYPQLGVLNSIRAEIW